MKKFLVYGMIYFLSVCISFSWKMEYPEFDMNRIHQDLIISNMPLVYNNVNQWNCLPSEFINISINKIEKQGVLMFKKYQITAYFEAMDNFDAKNQKGEPSRMLIAGNIKFIYEKNKLISATFTENPRRTILTKEKHDFLVKAGTIYFQFRQDFGNYPKNKFKILRDYFDFENDSKITRSQISQLLNKIYEDKNKRFNLLNSSIILESLVGSNNSVLSTDYRPIREKKGETGLSVSLDFGKYGDKIKITDFQEVETIVFD